MSENLPPLPPSDNQSLENNPYDTRYGYRAQEFWRGAEIIRVEDKPMVPCDHEFIFNTGGIICKKCHFGLLGTDFDIRDGKLFVNGEPVRFSKLTS